MAARRLAEREIFQPYVEIAIPGFLSRYLQILALCRLEFNFAVEPQLCHVNFEIRDRVGLIVSQINQQFLTIEGQQGAPFSSSRGKKKIASSPGALAPRNGLIGDGHHVRWR